MLGAFRRFSGNASSSSSTSTSTSSNLLFSSLKRAYHCSFDNRKGLLSYKEPFNSAFRYSNIVHLSTLANTPFAPSQLLSSSSTLWDSKKNIHTHPSSEKDKFAFDTYPQDKKPSEPRNTDICSISTHHHNNSADMATCVIVTPSSTQPPTTTTCVSQIENAEKVDVEYNFESSTISSFSNANVAFETISASELALSTSSNGEETEESCETLIDTPTSLSSKKVDKEDLSHNWFVSKFGVYSCPKSEKTTAILPSPDYIYCGEDAYFIAEQPDWNVYGICDGVGGWEMLNIDPSLFAWELMKDCKYYAESMTNPYPINILSKAYNSVVENNKVHAGSGTACVLSIHKPTGKIYSANLGDSGFIIIRDKKVIYRSKEKQHFFNAPFQLSIVPSTLRTDNYFMDKPSDAVVDECMLCDDDIIILATDGLWDNMFDSQIISLVENQLSDIKPELRRDSVEMEQAMKSLSGTIVKYCKSYSMDTKRYTPFARNAGLHGFRHKGGKRDDITVMAIHVSLHSTESNVPLL